MSSTQKGGTAMTASILCMAIFAIWSGFSCWQRLPFGFVVPSGTGPRIAGNGLAQRTTQFSAPMRSRSERPNAAQSTGLLGQCVGVLGLAVGLTMYRRSRDGSRITSKVMTVHTKFHPCKKGSRPMVYRKISRDIMSSVVEGFLKHPKRDKAFLEHVIKTQMHGRFQLKLESDHIYDNIPFHQMATDDGKPGGGFRGKPSKLGHHPEDPYYDRRFLNPGSFKKMAIAHWEIPENCTRQVTLKELVDAGVQYGHKSNKWNPKMLPYLYADNDGSHIFDLVMTAAGLNRACYYCMEAAARGAEFIVIGTKEAAREHIKKFGEETGVHYVDQKYVGGILSNFKKVRKSVEIMTRLRDEKQQGAWSSYAPGYREGTESMLRKTTRKYHGIEKMDRIPDICIFVDERKEKGAIQEMQKLGIPCVGLIDSDSDPTFVDLPIPGNASGSRSIELVLGKLADSIKNGKVIAAAAREGEKPVIPKEWDPWVFARERMRHMRRRTKRQPWMKQLYGSYEKWKESHPFGSVTHMAPFHEFVWNDFAQRQGGKGGGKGS
eukprot:TRINITY_DN58125_c0_g1_i1.p1 TRINITY_DN58125_c0_g1~~TRINITY_DN58125_c0_g1_i1.p1  ORF type:complete len:547 (-),score=78.35 TRINITY_DN58125_c0_g1_i1:62-1702(-)